MPRDIPQSALDLLDTLGIEPINIIEVQWLVDGPLHYYADRRFDQVEGKLVSISDLESVLAFSGSGSSTSVSIELDDSDSTIKNILDYNDIHNRPVKIYQWFTSLPFEHKFVIFEGRIATPIEWDEGTRVLTFEILTQVDDREVGFSVEDGDFVNVPEILLGKAWPMVFGTVVNIPTLQMDEIPTGTIRIPIGIPDRTLKNQVGYVNSQVGELLAKAQCLSAAGAKMEGQGIDNDSRQLFEQGQALQRQATEMRRQAFAQLQQESERLNTIEEDQSKYDVSVIPIMGGSKFLQGISIQLDINGATYLGIFQGDNFLVSARFPPDDPIPQEPKSKEIVNFEHKWVIVGGTQEEADVKIADQLFGRTQDSPAQAPTKPSETPPDPCGPANLIIWHDEPPENLFPQRERQFFFANAGSAVKITGPYPIRYILSIVDGTEVLELSARRNLNGLKVISPIPESYYTVSTLDFGGIRAVIATMHQPLSTLGDGLWEDEVYATLRSPIGPNVVDIIVYLIGMYTEFQIDSDSFSHVYNRVIPYPANFALFDRRNIIDLLRDIAFQARCALWISVDKFYIKYLPEAGTPVESISEDDIDNKSFVMFTTSTEDLVTKLVAEWKYDYSHDESNKIIMRYNVPKYGTKERVFNFFIYNNADLVIKSATFWLIRYANIWKKFRCKVGLHKLKLETFDHVTLDMDNKYVANVAINCQVEKAGYDPSDYTITLEAWTPVRLGEMLPYDFAYPADISIQLLFPTIEDIQAGIVGNQSQTGQVSGDLGGKFNVTVERVPGTLNGKGEVTQVSPSDVGNTAPPIITTVGNYDPSLGGAPPVAQQPAYDYTYHPIQQPQVQRPQAPSPRSMPAKVLSGSGDTYQLEVYPYGKNHPEDKLIRTAKVVDIDPSDLVLPDTWVIAHYMNWFEGEELIKEYNFFIPLWFEEEA